MNYKDILRNNPFTVAMILLATFISAITFVFSPLLAFIELLVIVSVAVFALKWLSKIASRKKEYLKNFEAFLIESGELGEGTASFPFPLVIVNNSGVIEWFNRAYNRIIDDMESKGSSDIKELFPDAQKFLTDSAVAPFEFKAGSRQYTVYSTRLNDETVALYFTEDTALKEIREEYNISRPAVLIINIDSLDQTEDVLDHADYYAVVTGIETEITKWLFDNKCVFRKFSDGKFFALTEAKNLDGLIDDKFSILDRIRAFRFNDTEMDITLSIGVGKEKDFTECELSAKQALDMARGRGGDQAAVKIGDKYEFFGGATSRKEKRGKIKSRNVSSALFEYIDNSENVFICGHSYSDFDAIGAAVGLAAIVNSCGKKPYIVVNRKTSLALPLIELVEKSESKIEFISPERSEELFTEASLLIVTDTMRKMLVEAQGILSMCKNKILIDHHRKTPDFIEDSVLEFLEPYASSACEMVAELVQYSPSKTKLLPVEAEALLSGIILDTKNYTLRVGVRTFEAAAYLKDCKADTVTVKKLFSASVEENILVSKMISAAEFFDRYAVAVAENGSNVSRLISSKTADELLSIAGVDASFVVSEGADTVYISARSLGKINVQLIMEKFGGGGHQSMAACQIKDGKLEDVLNDLHRYMDEYSKTYIQ